MIEVAHETDLMIRAFLDDLKRNCEHEVNRMHQSERIQSVAEAITP